MRNAMWTLLQISKQGGFSRKRNPSCGDAVTADISMKESKLPGHARHVPIPRITSKFWERTGK
jgi:hypothetical protein